MLSPSPLTIHAELAWSDHATAFGIVARGASPVLALCRKLVEAGYDPRTPLEAWRAGTLCLRVRSIGEGARLTVDEHNGTRFAKWKPFNRSAVSPPIAPDDGDGL
jgi:hypothetical protein